MGTRGTGTAGGSQHKKMDVAAHAANQAQNTVARGGGSGAAAAAAADPTRKMSAGADQAPAGANQVPPPRTPWGRAGTRTDVFEVDQEIRVRSQCRQQRCTVACLIGLRERHWPSGLPRAQSCPACQGGVCETKGPLKEWVVGKMVGGRGASYTWQAGLEAYEDPQTVASHRRGAPLLVRENGRER